MTTIKSNTLELRDGHPSILRAYKCSICGAVNHESSKMREFVGNVNVPDEGGLVGNNFIEFDYKADPEKNAPPPTFKHIFETDECKVAVCSTIVCIPCCYKILDIPSPQSIPTPRANLGDELRNVNRRFQLDPLDQQPEGVMQ